MQMTPEARLWLDQLVRRILGRHPVGEAERSGIAQELMSHLHGAGESHARAEGRTEVAKEDLEVALAESGGETGLADAFVSPFVKPLERVLLARRLGAILVDGLVLVVGLLLVHTALTALFEVAGGVSTAPTEQSPRPDAYWILMPWGFHDPGMPPPVQGVIAVASAALVLGYFTWSEGRHGRSVGKRVFDLRVLRPDGRPIGYCRAFLRNLAKLSPPLLLLDVLIMLVAFGKERQRASDKWAKTIVVRA